MTAINVICIKWGTCYNADDVNKLFRAIKRNTSYDIDFYCFTDDCINLEQEIIVKPLPEFAVNEKYQYSGYLKEAALCDNNLGNLGGKRVFFFDLDSLIVDNLDELFRYPQNENFYIINDWRHRHGRRKNTVGQASCYSFVVGTLGFVKEYFEKHSDEVWQKYGTASQEYLSAKVMDKYGNLKFWPDNWFKSFRFHCMPHPLLRYFIVPKIPKVAGLKMIVFHGVTGIPEALHGIWCKEENIKAPHGLKKIYKHVLPTTWIRNYWK